MWFLSGCTKPAVIKVWKSLFFFFPHLIPKWFTVAFSVWILYKLCWDFLRNLLTGIPLCCSFDLLIISGYNCNYSACRDWFEKRRMSHNVIIKKNQGMRQTKALFFYFCSVVLNSFQVLFLLANQLGGGDWNQNGLQRVRSTEKCVM